MKITGANTDYIRMVDSATVKPVAAVNRGEGIIDPLHRPVEHTPVEAVQQPNTDAEVRQKPASPDIVELSPRAKDAMFSQSKIEQMMQEKLAKALEAEGIDLSEHQGIDYSPDAVSQRIVDYSISLYGVFREQNEHLSEEESMNKFESTIRGAVSTGYGDAMKALEGIGLPEEVTSMGEETMSMVHSRFDEFFAQKRG